MDELLCQQTKGQPQSDQPQRGFRRTLYQMDNQSSYLERVQLKNITFSQDQASPIFQKNQMALHQILVAYI